MNRRGAWIVVASVLTIVLFASVTTSGGVQMWGEPQWDPTPRQSDPEELVSQPSTPPAQVEQVDEPVVEVPGWVDAVVRVILVVALIAGAVALLAAGWRHRPRVRWRRRFGSETDFEALPDVAAAIVDEAEARRAALLTGEARNAIVRCWLQLEADVAAVGLTRPPSDTSTEFTERVLGRYTVDPDAIHDLAARYREARFSEHAIDDRARHEALDALDRLHRGLRDFAAARDAAAEADAGAGAGGDANAGSEIGAPR